MEEIIINLKGSSDVARFKQEDGNLIHYRELNRVKDLIADRLNFLKKMKDEDRSKQNKFLKPRYHDTITIFGSRGSGKTTFLLNLLETIYSENKSNVEVLPSIDPTLIEEKGHVFLNVISLIEQKVRVKIEEDSCDPNSKDYLEAANWRRHIEALARGLPSIKGIGENGLYTGWQDPEYIMNNGIKSVTSSRELEENFNKLLSKGLQILGKQVFLLVFDDIDIDFEKGWQVLETVRRYLTSPQLIVVLSGDSHLLSLSIRKNQNENFNSGAGVSKELVTEMESQYLHKILKPERRIYLSTLKQKLDLLDNVPIYIEDAKGKKLIKAFYGQIFKSFGIANAYQREAYSSFLLSLPLRTQIRFLSVFDNFEEGVKVGRLTDVFLSELYEKRVNVDLVNSLPKFLNTEILNLLLREKVLSEGYQLQPITTDSALNSCLVALNFLFSQRVNAYPNLIFDYFIRIGYARNAANSLVYQNETKDDASYLTPTKEGLCRYAEISNDKVLRDITGLVTGYLLAASNSSDKLSGVIPLEALARTSKQGRMHRNRIDRVFEGDYRGCILGYIPLGIYKKPVKQDTQVRYSIYMLLGTISELIRKVREDDLHKGLLELSQIRTYPMPDFERKLGKEDGIVDETIDYEQSAEDLSRDLDNKEVKLLEKLIEDWVKKAQIPGLSPHVLGKIATRMHYACDTIASANNFDNLGDAMHYHVVAFLNAVVIEDFREQLSNVSRLNINNTNFSDRIFINNLHALIRSETKLDLTTWILACPLLVCYLNPRSEIRSLIEVYCKDVIDVKTFDISVYRQLHNVPVKGWEKIHQGIPLGITKPKYEKTFATPKKAVKLRTKAVTQNKRTAKQETPTKVKSSVSPTKTVKKSTKHPAEEAATKKKFRDGFYIEVRNKGANAGMKIHFDTQHEMEEASRLYGKSKDVIVLGERKKDRWLNEESGLQVEKKQKNNIAAAPKAKRKISVQGGIVRKSTRKPTKKAVATKKK